MLPNPEVTCGHLHCVLPEKVPHYLSSLPRIVFISPVNPVWVWKLDIPLPKLSEYPMPPTALDPQCQDQAFYKIHFSCWFPYKRWVEEEQEELLPVFYATVSLCKAPVGAGKLHSNLSSAEAHTCQLSALNSRRPRVPAASSFHHVRNQ